MDTGVPANFSVQTPPVVVNSILKKLKQARKGTLRFAKTHVFHFVMVMALALLAVSCGDDDDNNPVTPTVQQPTITGMTPTQVSLGEQVNGRITGTNLSGVLSVNLGDGLPVDSVQSVNANEIQVGFHVNRNAAAGARTITVTTAGGTTSIGGLLSVRNNPVPVVDFKISGGTKSKNQIVSFSATARDDKDIQGYRWDFGDGESANGKEVSHKFASAGVFTVTLTVTDNQGGKGTESKGVTIQDNFAPVAKFTGPEEIETGKAASFDGSQSTDSDGNIVEYSWDFGDGKSAAGKKVTHIFNSEKTYTVTLTVTDNNEASGLQQRQLRVEGGGGGGGGGGGSEGTCEQNDFRTNRGEIVAVNGNVVTLNRAFRKCSGCPEFRRRAEGLREFVGDIVRMDGFQYTMNYGRLGPNTRPQPGETVYLVWKPSHECRHR